MYLLLCSVIKEVITMMTIDRVVNYVLHTPFNTNKKILVEMLKQLIADNGGSEEPDTPSGDIIYDGGLEE